MTRTFNSFSFIGLGLIGGSIAKALRLRRPTCRILAYNPSPRSLEEAVADGVVDKAMGEIGPEIAGADLIFLCAPVEYNVENLAKLKPYLSDTTLITDIGSVKGNIAAAVRELGLSRQFVGGHPMTGSERSKYRNSRPELLENAYYLLTPEPESDPADVEALRCLAQDLGSSPIVLDPGVHDLATARISHLPHVLASLLVETVRDTDDAEGLLRRIAAGGFKDITRIASSSPVMWQQICLTNRDAVLLSIGDFRERLDAVECMIAEEDGDGLMRFFTEARDYRDSFPENRRGSVAPSYSLTVTIADRPGSLAEIVSLLASDEISIRNISITHNREEAEGSLYIEFYDARSLKEARRILDKTGHLPTHGDATENAPETTPLRGELTVPGDKSISHRAVMLGALAQGETVITGFLNGQDCRSTIDCFRRMGIEITEGPMPGEVHVQGRGLRGLTGRTDKTGLPLELYTGNSGTTTRILSGILAGQRFSSRLSGDASIAKRPMKRVMEPLQAMGAQIKDEAGNGCAPLLIGPAPQLTAIEYSAKVASAQVKSAVLLAGLYAKGETVYHEPSLSRDHTERMLNAMGAKVETTKDDQGVTIRMTAPSELTARPVTVPGDISSAAFFLAAALIVPGSDIVLRQVGLNETRAGILKVLERMGADITLTESHLDAPEPYGDLRVRSSHLKGTVIGGDEIPTLIDELPILAVLGCFAEGVTEIRDAAELKVKESDRIAVMTEGLKAMGADIEARPDGFYIRGGDRTLHGARVKSCGDHRAAMSFAVAALRAKGETCIDDAECVSVSYPGFYEDLQKLMTQP